MYTKISLCNGADDDIFRRNIRLSFYDILNLCPLYIGQFRRIDYHVHGIPVDADHCLPESFGLEEHFGSRFFFRNVRHAYHAVHGFLFLGILLAGCGFFFFEYLTQGPTWVTSPGSPHVFNNGNLGCGTVVDRRGNVLLDLTNGEE